MSFKAKAAEFYIFFGGSSRAAGPVFGPLRQLFDPQNIKDLSLNLFDRAQAVHLL